MEIKRKRIKRPLPDGGLVKDLSLEEQVARKNALRRERHRMKMLAKRAAKSSTRIQTPKLGTDWKQPNQGSGYLIPAALSSHEWRQLTAHWDSMLKSSGFNDIELKDADNKGFFSHVFTHDTSKSQSRNDIASTYNPDTEEFYRMHRLFYYHAPRNLWVKRFYREHRYICSHIMNGVTYTNIVAEIRSHQAPSFIPPTRSIYWVHTHAKMVEDCVRRWIDSNPEVLTYESDISEMKSG